MLRILLILLVIGTLFNQCSNNTPRPTYTPAYVDNDETYRNLCFQGMRGQLLGYIPGMTFPTVSNYGSGNEFYFAWPSGSLPGGASGSCIGTRSPLAVTQITINGQSVK